MDPELLMAAIDQRRARLGEMQGREALMYVEVAAQLGIHSAMFSRLRKGQLPNQQTQESLLYWLGADAEEFTACDACPADHAAEVDVEGVEDDNPAIVASEDSAGTENLADGDEEDPSEDDGEDPDEDSDDAETEGAVEKTAAIHGSGRLSASEDPETQAALSRVRELLAEGAVGVSIAHDMDPETMPSEEELKAAEKKAYEDDDWSELEALQEKVNSRPRHVAIVDTPAFSDAKLTLSEDGTVTGPIVFEGKWTGDSRRLPYGGLIWDEKLLPIPIIWDRHDGDHTGMTIGLIDTMWRVDDEDSALREEGPSGEDVDAVVAAAGTSMLSARYFDRFSATSAEPVHIDAPDASGMRRIWGHAAPRGVCHRSGNNGCFQYPGDADAQHSGFHTGAAVTLDNGETIRVGSLTLGGAHIDTKLAKQGFGVYDAGTHRDNANRTIAMVRAWEDSHGLAFSGVLMPDASSADLLRAQASAPSVELWPTGRGNQRTLIGIHLVPTPAWPVTASVGSAEHQMGITEGVVVEALSDEESAAELTAEPVIAEFEEGAVLATAEQVQELLASNERIEKALAIIIDAIDPDDIPNPDDDVDVDGDDVTPEGEDTPS